MNGAVAVVGCGSIGQRHIRNLCTLQVEPVLAFDPDPERLAQASAAGATACGTLEVTLGRRPMAVIVATPPDGHVAAAANALDAGAHVFVEKPLAASLDGIDALLARAAAQTRVFYVGYNLRFHAGLCRLQQLLAEGAIGRLLTISAEFGQYLPDWRPGRDYRSVYTANARAGGGVLLDVSHELDYVRWLAGEVTSVFAVTSKISDLEIEAEDTALITLRFASGVIGHVHLDCTQRAYSRSCKLVGSEGTLVWDFAAGVRWFSAGSRAWQHFPVVPDVNEMYLQEMSHFLACTRREATPVVPGSDGRRVLEIALAARRSAEEHCEVKI